MTLHGANLSELSFDGNDILHRIKMMADSESCLGVLRNEGFSRRVRHLCIAVCFIQRLAHQGLAPVSWTPTAHPMADIMTKVLSRELTERHRVSLGICELPGPESWQSDSKPRTSAKKLSLNEPNQKKDEVLEEFAISAVKLSPRSVFKNPLSDIEDDPTCELVVIDICTSGRAGLGQVEGKVAGIRVVSVTNQTPIQTVSNLLDKWMRKLQKLGVKFCVWMSPPCTGGSPMLNFLDPMRRAEIVKRHFGILVEILENCRFAKSADIRCLELSHSCTLWKEECVVNFVSVLDLRYVHQVHRCMYAGAPSAIVAKHAYRVATNREEVLQRLKTCKCCEHLPISKQQLECLGEYLYDLALRLGRNFKNCLTQMKKCT